MGNQIFLVNVQEFAPDCMAEYPGWPMRNEHNSESNYSINEPPRKNQTTDMKDRQLRNLMAKGKNPWCMMKLVGPLKLRVHVTHPLNQAKMSIEASGHILSTKTWIGEPTLWDQIKTAMDPHVTYPVAQKIA